MLTLHPLRARSLRSYFCSAAAACALAACGGGGDDAPPPSAPAGVTLTGVAATGAALPGATVEARCSGGSSGSATTAADGSYSISLTTGSLPCVLRATPAGGGTVLHSVAQGSGTAHVTPATQLIVATLAGVAPSAYYSAFDDTVAAALGAARVLAAHTSVVSLLTEGGIDVATVGNLLTGPLVAAHGGTPGNAHDQALEAMTQRLAASGLTLEAFTDGVVRTSPANTTPTANTPSLPPQALLQPASPTCSALRSGTYRVIIPMMANAGEFSTGTVQVDAVAGTLVDADGTVDTMTSAGTCIFDVTGGQFVVSQAGVIVLRSQEDGVMRMGIAFPEQAHTVAELAGAWHYLGFERSDTGTYGAVAASGTVGATGALSDVSFCDPVTACQAVTGVNIGLSANAAGGFDLTNTTDNWTDRLFAYRAGNGDLMLASLSGNGSFSLWTPRRTGGPVAVGVRQLSWGTWTGPSLVSSAAVSLSDFMVTANDATSWTRVAASDGHSETLTVNDPRNGWISRPEFTAATNGGGTVLVRGFYGLPLRGMGLSALSIPSLGGGAYFISVNQ